MLSEQIVVIDDDPRVIKTFEYVFPEYKILSFSSAEEALPYFTKPNNASIALVDIYMPGANGFSVLEEIKRRRPDIVVIVMSGYGTKDVIMQALRGKADDFLEKPFDVEALRIRIRDILREKDTSKPESRDRKDQVKRIREFIRKNSDRVQLKDIASELCLSPKHVSRLFAQETGISFDEFRLEAKMDTAKKLLTETSLNVNEISLKIGYQNPESFMRVFKRICQKTPSEFRQQQNLLTQNLPPQSLPESIH